MTLRRLFALVLVLSALRLAPAQAATPAGDPAAWSNRQLASQLVLAGFTMNRPVVPLVASDEEGGLVQRLRPLLPALPSAETIDAITRALADGVLARAQALASVARVLAVKRATTSPSAPIGLSPAAGATTAAPVLSGWWRTGCRASTRRRSTYGGWARSAGTSSTAPRSGPRSAAAPPTG